ncbi:MAG: N-acetyl-gamma-glutamyl-phosphate reductase [Caldilineaceae bacterium]
MYKAGIAGATGYTGFQLIQLIHRHPQLQIAWVTSENSAGKSIAEVHPVPWTYPLISLEEGIQRAKEVDVVFLCLPHGESIAAVQKLIDSGVRIIDLSADFRLPTAEIYKRWYKNDHAAPQLLPQFTYGLCEVNREQIRNATHIAVPGCYPTTVNLGLYPLAKAGWLEQKVIIDSKSGVSGAGKKAKPLYMFVEANENMTPYEVGYRHRHIGEMELVLNNVNGHKPHKFTFTPHLVPINQGMLSTMYVSVQKGVSEHQIRDLYAETYANEPFVHLLPAGQMATIHHTMHTNRVAISITAANPTEPDGQDFIIVCTEDNLIKGASGQALQNFNIMMGLDETLGLI